LPRASCLEAHGPAGINQGSRRPRDDHSAKMAAQSPHSTVVLSRLVQSRHARLDRRHDCFRWKGALPRRGSRLPRATQRVADAQTGNYIAVPRTMRWRIRGPMRALLLIATTDTVRRLGPDSSARCRSSHAYLGTSDTLSKPTGWFKARWRGCSSRMTSRGTDQLSGDGTPDLLVTHHEVEHHEVKRFCRTLRNFSGSRCSKLSIRLSRSMYAEVPTSSGDTA